MKPFFSMICSLRNKCTKMKNYCHRTILVRITLEHLVACYFFRHSVNFLYRPDGRQSARYRFGRLQCLLFATGRLKMRDRKMRNGQKCRGGKCRTGNCGTNMQVWKMHDDRVWKACLRISVSKLIVRLQK